MRPLAILLLLATATVAQTPADTAPKMTSAPNFAVSDGIIAAGIDGTMTVAVSIDESGNVKSAEVLAGPAWPCDTSPDKELKQVREAVREYFLGAKFEPVTDRDQRPDDARLLMNFALGRAYQAAKRDRQSSVLDLGRKIIQAGVTNGRAISLPKPDYPLSARASRISGPVSVWILYDEEGKVAKAGAVNGHYLLQDAARDAACKARFTPTILSGQAVKVSGIITYNFVPGVRR